MQSYAADIMFNMGADDDTIFETANEIESANYRFNRVDFIFRAITGEPIRYPVPGNDESLLFRALRLCNRMRPDDATGAYRTCSLLFPYLNKFGKKE